MPDVVIDWPATIRLRLQGADPIVRSYSGTPNVLWPVSEGHPSEDAAYDAVDYCPELDRALTEARLRSRVERVATNPSRWTFYLAKEPCNEVFYYLREDAPDAFHRVLEQLARKEIGPAAQWPDPINVASRPYYKMDWTQIVQQALNTPPTPWMNGGRLRLVHDLSGPLPATTCMRLVNDALESVLPRRNRWDYQPTYTIDRYLPVNTGYYVTQEKDYRVRLIYATQSCLMPQYFEDCPQGNEAIRSTRREICARYQMPERYRAILDSPATPNG